MLISALLASPSTAASCPSDEQVDAYVEDYLARRPNPTYTAHLTLDQATCARRLLIARLAQKLGPLVGYKVMFAQDTVRGMYGFDEPVWGAMFASGLMQSPAVVSASYGAAPWWESGLVVKVADPRLADARTPLQALRHIRSVMPYIELTDYMTPNPPKLVHYFANNASFRAGVLGTEIAARPTKAFAKALADMTITATDRVTGFVYHRASGARIMNGHPLHAVIWLAQSLRTEGIALKAGDLVSVSFTAGVWAQNGQSVEAKYTGLPGSPVVALRFE